MRIVVLPADVDPSSSALYSADVECFHQFVETQPLHQPQLQRILQLQRRVTPSRRFLLLALIPVFIVIVVVSSVLVSKNSSASPSQTASSSSTSTGTGGTFTTSTGGTLANDPSAPPTTSPKTRSSGTDETPTAPAVAPTSYSEPSSSPSSPSDTAGTSGTTPSLPDASSPTSPLPLSSLSPSSLPSSTTITTSQTASEIEGATVSSGPLYDESVLADHWLYAHNSRRDTLYAQHDLSPKHLKWSDALAASALNYSESLLTLLPGCTIQHGLQGNHDGGENLAMMWDTGFAVTVLPELVLQAWFDNEQGQPFGRNGHWSQVAWRGSGYVGCGMAKKIPATGFSCYVSTCRYVATGNCNMDASNQLDVMLQDTSPCLPACPAEGCF